MSKLWFKSTSFDNESAGWYANNSIIVKDIVPEWRATGGGVSKSSFVPSLTDAYALAIEYTKQRISDAELHLKRLEKERSELS